MRGATPQGVGRPPSPAAAVGLQVRREAVRCLGLYCFLDGIPTSPASHLLVLRQVLLTPGETSAVKAVAAQVRPAARSPWTSVPVGVCWRG